MVNHWSGAEQHRAEHHDTEYGVKEQGYILQPPGLAAGGEAGEGI